MSWWDDAKEAYDIDESFLKTWKEKTLQEALSAGLSGRDLKSPDGYSGDISLRVDREVDNIVRMLARSRRKGVGYIYKVLTKHGACIMYDEFKKLDAVVAVLDRILEEMRLKYCDNVMIERQLYDVDITLPWHVYTEDVRYSVKVHIRPVWWVYYYICDWSSLTGLSRSVVTRLCIISSLSKYYKHLEKRLNNFMEILKKHYTNIIYIIGDKYPHVPVSCYEIARKEIEKLYKLDKGLYEKLISVLNSTPGDSDEVET